jgi:hypothetical protein
MAAAIPFKEIQWKKAEQLFKWKWIYPAAVCIIGITVLIVTSINFKAGHLYNKAQADLQSNKPFDEITASLDSAIQLKSTHPEYVLTKIDLMLQGYNQLKDGNPDNAQNFFDKAQNLAAQLKKTEPYNRQLLEYQYNMALLKDNKEAALALVKEGLNTFQWDSQLYERAIDLSVQLGEKHWADALDIYNNVLLKDQSLLALPKGQAQGREFKITQLMRASIGQIYYAQKKYPEAIDILKPGIVDSLTDPNDRVIVRYYLASLKMMQLNDQVLYDKLIASDAAEKEKLEKLLSQ